jgi:hypothetical protein
MKGYGFNLLVVYTVWLGVTAIAYPLRKRYDKYKTGNKVKWRLSYR